jgi:thiamine pyrophosphate-dependent acetolactate synthase large subunit-like protein
MRKRSNNKKNKTTQPKKPPDLTIHPHIEDELRDLAYRLTARFVSDIEEELKNNNMEIGDALLTDIGHAMYSTHCLAYLKGKGRLKNAKWRILDEDEEKKDPALENEEKQELAEYIMHDVRKEVDEEKSIVIKLNSMSFPVRKHLKVLLDKEGYLYKEGPNGLFITCDAIALEKVSDSYQKEIN